MVQELEERPEAKLSEQSALLYRKEVSEVARAPAVSGVPHSQHNIMS